MTPPTSDQTVPLTKREEIAEGTMAFHFAKPADFQFRAGQSIDLTLLNPPEADVEGNSRAFSIASAPFDNDLMIATRIANGKAKSDTSTRICLQSTYPHCRGRSITWQGPAMVAAVRRTLIEAGVDEDDIRTEEFSGY